MCLRDDLVLKRMQNKVDNGETDGQMSVGGVVDSSIELEG
jgi:hypothetical protein